MVDRNNIQDEISKLTQTSTNLLLENLLRKHNVKMSNDNFTKEQKAQIKKLVQDLQESFQKLQKEEKN